MRDLEIKLLERESAMQRSGTEIETGEVTYEEVLVYLKEFLTRIRGADRTRFKQRLSEIGRN
jgi:hypothetical protein